MTVDHLEQLAHRTERRGAANVWADAQPDASPPNAPSQGAWLFRTVLILGLLAASYAVLALSTGDPSNELATSVADSTGSSEELLPMPLLIDGASLDRVVGPSPNTGDEDWEAVVFSSDPDSFTAPMIGFTSSAREERQWIANVFTGEQQDAIWEGLIPDGQNGFVLAPGSDLVEVWRSTPDTWSESWIFMFEDNWIHAAPANQTAWSFLANDVTAEFGRVEVTELIIGAVGQTGYLVTPGASDIDGPFDSETLRAFIIWSDGDFIYQIDSANIEDTLDALQLVDRETWTNAVERAEFLNADEPSDLPLWVQWIVLFPLGALVSLQLWSWASMSWQWRLAMWIGIGCSVIVLFGPTSLFIAGLVGGAFLALANGNTKKLGPRRITLFMGLVVLVGLGVWVASTFQDAVFPGSPRPDAELAEALVQQGLVDDRFVAETIVGSVRTEDGEWSFRFGDEVGLVEWRNGEPQAVDFDVRGDITLGVSESGELLVADLVGGDVEVSTLEQRVSLVNGGETPIREVIGVDDRMLFGWTDEGFGAFPLSNDGFGASHLLDARDVREVHAANDSYILFALNPNETNTLVRWSLDAGFETLLELPDVQGIQGPSVGVAEDGTVYLGIDDSVWRTAAPYEQLELVTQARQDRSGRWLGWVDIAPDASAWIYHEVDSGYLLTGGPNEDWRQAAYLGVPIGEDFRLGDGDSQVIVAYADAEQIVVDTYEGRIWIDR